MSTTINNFISLKDYTSLGLLKNRIYKINSPTGKVYVGKFSKITRLNAYRNLHCKDQPALYRSFLKHGVENHTLQILTDQCSQLHMSLYEEAFIRYFNSHKNGLNCTIGGDGISMTEQIRRKISEGNKGKIRSKQTIQKMSTAKIGKPSLRKGRKFIGTQKGIRKPHLMRKYNSVALDQNGIFQLVYPKRFLNNKKSPWHSQCDKLAQQQTRLNKRKNDTDK